MFIHGREDGAEEIVQDIERTVTGEHGDLGGVDETLTIRQRKTIPLTTIAKTVFTLYPKRTVLCLSLFAGQAFLYNAFFFTYGDTLGTFMDVKQVGWYLAAFAACNFAGALLLGPLFDKVGRVKMIAGTYILSGVLLAVAGTMLGDLTPVTLTMWGGVIFFFASAGASAAYLTASEVFPMETRALCIAFFYAVGTAIGGISGPLLFGKLIEDASASKDITQIAIGYFIGAALMVFGGVMEILLGVKAEGRSLESIAQPLTAEEDASPEDEHAGRQPV
jgi:MFS family permease